MDALDRVCDMIPITEQEYQVLNGWEPEKISELLKKYSITMSTAEVVCHKMTDGTMRYYVRDIK